MLPNFIVIGAAKSGTTSLWQYLVAHPEIFMSRQKELVYFSKPEWRERLSWYEEQFAGSTEPLRGEASVRYSQHPFVPGVAARIHELIPDARLIYMVRDPLPRAISAYVQNVASGGEKRTIDEAFADLDDPTNEYLCSSRYAAQLDEYLEHFSEEQIFVADQTELLHDRANTLARIFEFLGVDRSFRSQRFDELVNTRQRQMGQTRIGVRLRTTPAANMIRRLPKPIGTPVVALLRRAFWRKVEREPKLDPALATEFVDRVRPDAERFSGITGLPIDHWTL